MDYKFAAIIEARMLSSRLEGKVLKKIHYKEILRHIIERVKKSQYLENVVVATTNNRKDDKIISLLKKLKINFFRGSSQNVLDRIIRCADKYKIKYIVRITADNPFTDYKLIDYMINYFNKCADIDFLANNHYGDPKKRKIAYGLDLSLFSLSSLKKVRKLSNKKKIFLEYPTLYYHTKGKHLFKIKNILLPRQMIINNNYRLTIDTKEDFKFIKRIFNEYKKVYKKYDYLEINKIRKILNKKKNLTKFNSKIKQFVPEV